jgi:hypothetical protein
VLWNANICENAGNGTPNTGSPETVIPFVSNGNNGTWVKGYRWANDDLNSGDVLLSSGLSSTGDEGKLKGQFYDMVYVAEAFSVDTTDTFNGHNWRNLTSSNSGSAGGGVPRGGIWMAIS